MKRKSGKSLFIFGSADLTHSLRKGGLIDEYRIGLNPLLLGGGRPMFTPNDERVRLKCRLGDPAEIDSVAGIWRSAGWYEREVFDLFGIAFRNHPDLRRILLPEDWTEHPLRKDYPVHGRRYDCEAANERE